MDGGVCGELVLSGGLVVERASSTEVTVQRKVYLCEVGHLYPGRVNRYNLMYII